MKPLTRSEIEAKVLEALNEDGPRVLMTPEEWESIRREARERLAAQLRKPESPVTVLSGATGSSANPCASDGRPAHGFADEPVAPGDED